MVFKRQNSSSLDLSLADEGYYFCRTERMGEQPSETDLTELIMWARPNAPVISIEEFLYSNNVHFNDTSHKTDYSKPQDVALCTSTEGHPSPTLAFYENISNQKLSNDQDIEASFIF